MHDPLLRVINLSKQFGTTQAVQHVNFEVYPGEVVGLAGRIGAGKTVLAMLLAGTYSASQGDIYFENRRLQWPFATRPLGIEVIYQEPSLIEQMDVTSNIFLGHELRHKGIRGRFKILDHRRMREQAQAILDEIGVEFPPLHEKVSQLSSEHRQLVAIARVMTHTPKLILVDKPTSLLSEKYQSRLLSLIQTWQRRGTAVLFGSNNLNHLFAVTDRIIVLRQGQQVATFRTDETNREAVVAALVGSGEEQQTTPAIWALDNYYHARQQAERLRYEQTRLEANLAAQDSLNRQLIDQLEEQVTALDQVNIALQAAQRRLLTEREQERKHLARELHDQLIQDLLSLNYDLEEIGSGEITLALQNDLVDVQEHIRSLIDDLRRICGNLRPPTIDSLGLGAAIQSYTHEWARRTGIRVELLVDPELGRLPEALELSLFRIMQEGLSNVRKHAQASQVTVQLQHTTLRMVKMVLADNGNGLQEGVNLAALSVTGHYGLLGISERVALLGGRLQLRNRLEGGLRLEVEMPHPRITASVHDLKKVEARYNTPRPMK